MFGGDGRGGGTYVVIPDGPTPTVPPPGAMSFSPHAPGEATGPLAQVGTEEVAEGTGSPRVAGLAAEADRLGVRGVPDLAAVEAPAALVGLEVLVAVALEAGPGTTMEPAEAEAREDSLHQAVGRHHREVTRVEEVEVRLASGQKGRIGVGPPTLR